MLPVDLIQPISVQYHVPDEKKTPTVLTKEPRELASKGFISQLHQSFNFDRLHPLIGL